uniref:Glyceraldehyde-3-phosphate dehydrogenase n=1 Tax=Trichonympha agilis TaxID=63628 RepID=Q76DW3_9EUKA|nr:glyceraldehyde-3-phosphate dehydrogenase [Trichonympha agilis]
MPIKIAINGFGRIGRLVFRAIFELYPTECQVVAIHDLCPIKTNVHLLKYDSAHGRFKGDVKIGSDEKSFICSSGSTSWTVQNLSEKVGPSELPWADLGVDFVLESTGFYKTAYKADASGKVTTDGYDGHIKAGAKKVVLSVPASDAIQCTLVCGVNDEDLTPAVTCISNASCTTNCLGPVAKVINDNFHITSGFMTTVHSYTNDQKVADLMHSDLRRARAAAINIIPTSTGAAKALPIVVKALPPKCLDGLALRVPTITGSLVDLSVNVKEVVTVDQVNAALKAASEDGPLKGILKYTEDEIVSTDIIHDPHSSILDSKLTKVIPNTSGNGTLVKVLSWYDNEWMYSCRCADIFKRLGSIK